MRRRIWGGLAVAGVGVLLLTGCAGHSASAATLQLTSATSTDGTSWKKLDSTVKITRSATGHVSLAFEGPCGAVQTNGLTIDGDTLQRGSDTSTAATAQGCVGTSNDQRGVLMKLLGDEQSELTTNDQLSVLTLDGAVGTLKYT